MLIVLYRQSGKEIDQLLKDLCSKFDISYTYQKECNFWMLLQFILPGLNDTLCIIFYYLTMCLLGMWCFYYIGVVMAEMR